VDLAALEQLGISIQSQALLADFTTFHLGGTCPLLFTCRTPQQIEQTVQYCHKENHEFILIGGGSNLVVSDHGLECHVIRYVSESPLIELTGNDLIVTGSTLLDQLVEYCIDNSLEGLNYATDIPGTVGGAIVGNAGAFGKQVGDVLDSVVVIDKAGQKKELKKEDLKFTYRNSILKKTGDIVISARFSLKPGDAAALQKERDETIEMRHSKMPAYPCAGSFFRNIEPTSKAEKRQAAGWFLQEAGGLQLSAGGVKVFEHHANTIVNMEGGHAQDVFELSKKMAQVVKDKFNLDLVREVQFVGKFDGMPENVRGIIW